MRAYEPVIGQPKSTQKQKLLGRLQNFISKTLGIASRRPTAVAIVLCRVIGLGLELGVLFSPFALARIRIVCLQWKCKVPI